MGLLVTDVGDAFALGVLVNKIAQGDLKLRLYKNNITPAKGDTVSTYTEVTENGYAPITLTGSNWSINTVSDVTTAVFPEQTFNISVAVSAYGYYITDNSGATVIWAEKFPTVYTLASSGGQIFVTPTIELD